VAEQQDQYLLQWYTRREGVVRGPFSAEMITRHILLGRIRLDDELSEDAEIWSPAILFIELLPQEVMNLADWDDYQLLAEARARADERSGERRCKACTNPVPCMSERRNKPDRRRDDGNLLVNKHFFDGSLPGNRKTKPPARLRVVLLTLLLASLMLILLVPPTS
jgi:hypothetical protein